MSMLFITRIRPKEDLVTMKGTLKFSHRWSLCIVGTADYSESGHSLSQGFGLSNRERQRMSRGRARGESRTGTKALNSFEKALNLFSQLHNRGALTPTESAQTEKFTTRTRECDKAIAQLTK